jgi:hypothetical protein
VDGTKIEANANRYTFVWGKSIATQKQKIRNQLESLWAYAQKVYNAELQEPKTPDFTEISAEKVEETIWRINQKLKDKEIDLEVKKSLITEQNTGPKTYENTRSSKRY